MTHLELNIRISDHKKKKKGMKPISEIKVPEHIWSQNLQFSLEGSKIKKTKQKQNIYEQKSLKYIKLRINTINQTSVDIIPIWLPPRKTALNIYVKMPPL